MNAASGTGNGRALDAAAGAGGGVESRRADTAGLLAGVLEEREDVAAVRRAVEVFLPPAGLSGQCLHARAVDWLVADLARRGVELAALPADVQEPEFLAGLGLVERQGRRLSADFLLFLHLGLTITRTAQWPAERRAVVLELGCGIGELTRVLRLLAPDGRAATHVLVDEPETLAVAERYLRLALPAATSAWARDAGAAEATDADFVFVPVERAAALAGRRFDVAVTTSGVGRLTGVPLPAWLGFVQREIEVEQVAALGRFLNTRRLGFEDWRPAEAQGLAHADARWRTLAWQLEPSYLRCPFVAVGWPRCVEWVARRESAESGGAGGAAGAPRARGQALLEDLRDCYWFRRGDGDALEATTWDHPLASDGGMDGALCKLWEAVRLAPGPASLRLMLRQLDLLGPPGGRYFEEMFHYEGLLAQWAARAAPPDPAERREIERWLGERCRARPDLASFRRHLAVTLKECEGRRLVCYGVGRDFEALAAEGVFRGQTIVGLLDDRRPPGGEVAGYRLCGSADLARLQPEVIVATSSRFAAVLRERARGLVAALGLAAEVR